MSNTVKERIKNGKAQMIEQLTKVPIVQVAVERTNVARSTYYRWLKDDKDFEAEVNKALVNSRNIVTDLAESQLINNIKNGNMTAIIYWLKNHCDRYQEHYGLTVKEQQNLLNYLFSTNTNIQFYQLITELVLSKKLPIKLANYLRTILKQINSDKTGDIEKAKLKLFNKILKS